MNLDGILGFLGPACPAQGIATLPCGVLSGDVLAAGQESQWALFKMKEMDL